MSRETHDLILAAALLSISLNPFVFLFTDRMGGRPRPPVSGSPEAKQAAIDHKAEMAGPNPATA